MTLTPGSLAGRRRTPGPGGGGRAGPSPGGCDRAGPGRTALTLGPLARRGRRLGVGVLGLLQRGPAEGSVDPQPHPQASQTEQELQRELDSLQGQCQAQALAGAELRTQLESLQGEVSAGWGRGSVEWGRLAWGLSGRSLALHS